tara:strand:+ start:41320 stop:42567 length:1248 start_codon:yes stop_codon:yes gene_type:complete
MVSISKNIEYELKEVFNSSKEIWVAVAMMNNGGFSLINDLSIEVTQNIVVGVDLPTPPKTLRKLLTKCSSRFSAKIYESEYTYHPKLYIAKSIDGVYCAFVGSSNATYSGLNKNIELNVKITDQVQCKKLVDWYREIESEAKLLTDNLIDTYAVRYNEIKKRSEKLEEEIRITKSEMDYGSGQFFSPNQHAIFSNQYRKVNSYSLLELRKDVRSRLIDLHNRILPQFENYGLFDLHPNSRKQDRTSRHYINSFSGKIIQSIWLHYGKSRQQLEVYSNKDDQSFINHARIQVIIHDNNVGVWLVLGKDWGSRIDRTYFRSQMENVKIRNEFFDAFKALGDDYWIDYKGWRDIANVNDIESVTQLHEIAKEESIKHYFIIGKNYDIDDQALSNENIGTTILEEFKKLYPIYLMMRSE